ncbi:MAG: hypothetical protein IT432_02030 [Phycisphaerales bacterium]|nr:hypothetical protein [Phycisphaerales bacterium]
MFAKLAAIILALGILGCTLLAMRQQRLQAAHELAEAQLRIRKSDEQLWLLRAQIARRLNPENIRDMATDAGPLRPAASPPPPVEPPELMGPPAPKHADGGTGSRPSRPAPGVPHERLAHEPESTHPEPR